MNLFQTLVMALKSQKTLLELLQEGHADRQWCDLTIQYKGGALPCHRFVD